MISKNKIKDLKKLKHKKYRNNSDIVLVEGKRIVEQLLTYNLKPEHIFIAEDCIQLKNIFAKEDRNTINYVNHNTIVELSDTKNPQEIVTFYKKPKNKIPKQGTFIYLDDIRDPGNLGTIFRTSLALGVDGIFLSLNCCEVLSPKVIRSSLGSVFKLPYTIIDIADLNIDNCDIFSAEMEGSPIDSITDLRPNTILIIGNEANGVSKEVSAFATEKVSIPMTKYMESLNASVACSILTHSIVSKKRNADS